MSKVVYRGIQSCTEPQTHEKTTLRLKLTSPNSIDKNRGASVLDSHNMALQDKIAAINTANTENATNLEKGCWNFLHSYTNSPKIQEKTMGVEYIDPYNLSSFSRLSGKSLEICTENLGSETGSDTMYSSISSMDLENITKSYTNERKSTRLNVESRKEKSRSFPPPLTSISGSNHVLVRSHCEDGRLIIKAVEPTPSNTTFHVERSNGRLRLSFLKNNVDSKMDNGDKEIVEHEKCEENEEEYDQDDEKENDGNIIKGIDENRCEVEGKMGKESFQRPSRCKENGHGEKRLYHFEPFWVAT